jgi:hypothetical protein
MSSSKSSPTNSTSTATSLTTKNLNVSGNSGFTAVGGEGGSQSLNVSNTTDSHNISVTSDYGAIDAATGLSTHALDIVSAANRDSLDFASDIVGQSNDITRNALTTVSRNADNTVSVIQNLATQFGSSLFDFESEQQKQIGNTVSALNQTYQDNTTNANTQVLNAGTNIVKYAALAAVAVAALYLLTRR